MDIYYDKEKGAWDVLEPPYCTVEFPTKEDYDRFLEMVDFWNAHHKERGDE